MTLDEAFLLFARLGVDARTLSPEEFRQEYYALARRYHPDIGNQETQALMANINVARDLILASYRQTGAFSNRRQDN